MNNLDTKYSRKFIGYKHRIRFGCFVLVFNGPFSDLLREQNRTERQMSQNVQARVFPMRSAGSNELFSTRESSS